MKYSVRTFLLTRNFRPRFVIAPFLGSFPPFSARQIGQNAGNWFVSQIALSVPPTQSAPQNNDEFVFFKFFVAYKKHEHEHIFDVDKLDFLTPNSADTSLVESNLFISPNLLKRSLSFTEHA